jgi:hypothetical protein
MIFAESGNDDVMNVPGINVFACFKAKCAHVETAPTAGTPTSA